jgi:hypothetical protein
MVLCARGVRHTPNITEEEKKNTIIKLHTLQRSAVDGDTSSIPHFHVQKEKGRKELGCNATLLLTLPFGFQRVCCGSGVFFLGSTHIFIST